MKEYEDIVRGHDRAVSTLSSSSVVQFFVSALVMTVAIGGAAINFSLIARPMAEMVGGTSYIGTFRTADVAALVIIMVEISMGLFLMESLRITRLFPVIGALPDKMRVRMVWITFTILVLLASVEAGLAYMREVLLQDELATGALLRGETAVACRMSTCGSRRLRKWAWASSCRSRSSSSPSLWRPSFTRCAPCSGCVGIAALRALALLLRVLSNGCRHLGSLLQRIYDSAVVRPSMDGSKVCGCALGTLGAKSVPYRRHKHEMARARRQRLHARRLPAGGPAQQRRLSVAGHLWYLQRGAAESAKHHSLHALAA